MILSPSKNFVVTSDRDEKIRVSHFPDAYNIQEFCLGHKSFVTKLLIPNHQPHLLVSGAGDGTLKLWNYNEGILLSTLELIEGNVVSSLSYCIKNRIFCALIEGQPFALILEITKSEELHIIQYISFKLQVYFLILLLIQMEIFGLWDQIPSFNI